MSVTDNKPEALIYKASGLFLYIILKIKMLRLTVKNDAL